MKQYINYNTNNKSNYSFKRSFELVFHKVETILFIFLCLAFLVISKINLELRKDISFAFVNVSIPVANFISFPINSTISLLTNFHELVEAKKQNKVLTEELKRLRALYVKSLNIHQENKKLRDILNFSVTKSSSFKIARIIGKSHKLFNQQVFIDAGENKGIKEGLIVTGDKAAIGRVVEVKGDIARLMLITDASSRIPIITSNARVRGILAGNGGENMEILYLPKNHMIKKGEHVFTSGDGDQLPIGLLVGIVDEVNSGYASVKMIEDVNNIDLVTIMSYWNE